MATVTKEFLMKKSVDELLELCIKQNTTIETLKKEKDALRKQKASEKVRQENKDLKLKVQKYETIISKFAKVEI